MTKKKYVPLILSAWMCIIALVVMTAVLIQPVTQSEQLTFTPPPFDQSAVKGTPDVPKDLGWGEIDAQVYTASVCGVVVLSDHSADVWFTNPESNSVWLKLRVLDDNGNILGETGIIKPGEYVQTLTFTEIPKMDDTIALKLMAYEAETYYSAGSAALITTITRGNK